jgi:hypothetical protein
MQQTVTQHPYPEYREHGEYREYYGGRKSVGLAIFLAFLFGPVGLLYASVMAGCILLVINLIDVLFLTRGVVCFFTWLAGLFIAGMAAEDYNRSLSRRRYYY